MADYYFDMSGHIACSVNGASSRDPAIVVYGRGFRIGDRAAAYVFIHRWRETHRDDRLTVYDDSSWPECRHASSLTAHWLFHGLANVIHDRTANGVPPSRPQGTALYTRTVWEEWYAYAMCGRLIMPPIRPDADAVRRMRDWLPRRGIRGKYVAIQPTIDLQYDAYRNRPLDWWRHLADVIERMGYPVVVLGDHGIENRPLVESGQHSAMDTLAVAADAALLIGGQTGVTLWAPMFGVPTIGLYREVNQVQRPLSFGAAVRMVQYDDYPAILMALCDWRREPGKWGEIARPIPGANVPAGACVDNRYAPGEQPQVRV